jgi:hypothetical protein
MQNESNAETNSPIPLINPEVQILSKHPSYTRAQIALIIYYILSPPILIVSSKYHILAFCAVLFFISACGLMYLIWFDPGEHKHSKGDGDMYCTLCMIVVHNDAFHCKYCNKVMIF